MIFPSTEEYIKKSENYNLIPVCKEFIVDTETPVSIFIKAGGLEKNSFLLESIEVSKNISRYSFIGVDYDLLVSFNEGNMAFNSSNNNVAVKTRTPLDELQKIMNQYHPYKNPAMDHFIGGAVGYLSYNLVKYFENISLPSEFSKFPEMMLFLTDKIIVFDHALNKMKIIATIKIDSGVSAASAYNLSVEKIEEIEEKIFKGKTNSYSSDNSLSNGRIGSMKSIESIQGIGSIGNIGNDIRIGNTGSMGSNVSIKSNGSIDFSSLSLLDKSAIKSNFKKEDFLEAVEKAKKYIIDGEVFQMVLSQRFNAICTATPFNIYRVLRTINPSPYMYYINFEKFKIIGSSPEPRIKIKGRKILTYPIAGTRKRGKSKSEDRRLINELLKDQKERVEHNMLVDLARNDLGRVCRFGSVKISKYMYAEKYSHVIHLISRIEGILEKDRTIYDALKSVFPAGTLTGAPKIRTMQLISSC